MRLLIDTHVLIWAFNEPERLSARAREALEESENTIVVSSVSAYEIALKFGLGKLSATALTDDFEGRLRELQAEHLPVTMRHALRAGSSQNPHRDPFDRMLAAQSLLEGLPLVSGDRVFETFDVQRYW